MVLSKKPKTYIPNSIDKNNTILWYLSDTFGLNHTHFTTNVIMNHQHCNYFKKVIIYLVDIQLSNIKYMVQNPQISVLCLIQMLVYSKYIKNIVFPFLSKNKSYAIFTQHCDHKRISMTRITAGSGRCQRHDGQDTEKGVNPLVRHQGSSQPNREIASAQLLLDGMYSQYIQVRRAYGMMCIRPHMRSRSGEWERPLMRHISAATLSIIHTPSFRGKSPRGL